MQITNEQIIQSARRQRQAVDSRMDVEPWKPRIANHTVLPLS